MSAEACNIARYLPEMAARQPDALAIAIPTGEQSGGRSCIHSAKITRGARQFTAMNSADVAWNAAILPTESSRR